MADREKHIKNLSYIMDSMPDDACSEWRDSLAYAISSLKTDLKYDLLYEGEEVYDKDTVAWMFRELQLEIEELDSRAGYSGDGMPTFSTDYIRKKKVNELIQQKINALKEDK